MKEHSILENIQISRGIASIIVLLAHANLIVDRSIFSGMLIPGWSGVDFFFVLSGFIIYKIHRNDIGVPSKILPYVKKRFFRIAPIYWLYTLIVIAANSFAYVAFHKTLVTWCHIDLLEIIKMLMFIPTDIRVNSMPIIPVAWTLSYEVYFYMLFGAAIILPKKLTVIAFSCWIIAISVISFNQPGVSQNAVNYLLFSTKNYEFILGILVAYLSTIFLWSMNNIYALIILCLGITACCMSWINAGLNYAFFREVNHSISFGIPYAMVIFSLVIIELNKNKNVSPKKHSRIRGLFLFFGDASYSIYLTHYIVIAIACGVFGKFKHIARINAYLQFGIVCILALAVGCASYEYLEKKMIRYAKKL